jgi:hypothetical protein
MCNLKNVAHKRMVLGSRSKKNLLIGTMVVICKREKIIVNKLILHKKKMNPLSKAILLLNVAMKVWPMVVPFLGKF